MTIPSHISEYRDLAGMTSFRIGGPARYFSEPSTTEEIAEAYAFARDVGLPVLVMGGGSNLLVASAGVEAMVIRLCSRDFGGIYPDSADSLVWHVGAAAGLPGVLDRAAEDGMSGLEFLAGIPGRIGGAAAMNAGGAGRGIGSRILEAEGIGPDGKAFLLAGPELAFRYRGSALDGLAVVRLAIAFEKHDDPVAVRGRMREFREKKRLAQPVGSASAGCVFTNPPGVSAGILLDRAGCKGMREGGAVVSGVHANFIVNDGGATSGDVARLALLMRERVCKTAGTALACEIRMWGEDPAFDELRRLV